MIWNYLFSKKLPEQRGWYPVLICYDPVVGFIPTGAYFDGKRFDEIVVAYGEKCKTQEQAESLAYLHNNDI